MHLSFIYRCVFALHKRYMIANKALLICGSAAEENFLSPDSSDEENLEDGGNLDPRGS